MSTVDGKYALKYLFLCIPLTNEHLSFILDRDEVLNRKRRFREITVLETGAVERKKEKTLFAKSSKVFQIRLLPIECNATKNLKISLVNYCRFA